MKIDRFLDDYEDDSEFERYQDMADNYAGCETDEEFLDDTDVRYHEEYDVDEYQEWKGFDPDC